MLNNKFYLILCSFLIWNTSLAQDTKKNFSKKWDYLIKLKTDFGEMTLLLYESTPKHRTNFLKLAKEGFYNDLLFHRVIKDFMIQGGDPKSKNAPEGEMLGSGGLDYRVDAEFKPELIHKKGALAAARDGNPQKASSSCQFYIVQGKIIPEHELDNMQRRTGMKYTKAQKEIYQSIGGTPHLDNNYTVFGEVIQGIGVLDSIASQKTNAANRPLKNISMRIEVVKMSKKKISKIYGYTYPSSLNNKSKS
jgi:cyclophilin family peptidyl-prolyl cis-trans isomerase